MLLELQLGLESPSCLIEIACRISVGMICGQRICEYVTCVFRYLYLLSYIVLGQRE